jgi:lipopolysaccharide transport system permease protein
MSEEGRVMPAIEGQLETAVDLQGAPPLARNPRSMISIEPSGAWRAANLKELWTYRELLYFLIWRDVKIRYKQTAIGAAWAILQPLLTMLIFTFVFRRIANIPSDGIPYALFAFTALLPWNYFSGALSRCSASIVDQSNLISKVYFPRLIVPIAATVSGIVDFAIAFVILIAMMAWYGIGPSWQMLTLPGFLLLASICALSLGLWLSALNVRYRDVGHAVPFLVQVWMFSSPIAYPVSLVPENWRLLYSLNPLVGVIEGFRWALLGKESPDFGLMAISAATVLVLLVGGVLYFKKMERSFADVI